NKQASTRCEARRRDVSYRKAKFQKPPIREDWGLFLFATFSSLQKLTFRIWRANLNRNLKYRVL
ncbi:hypothetical protein OAR27_03465, partial [Alphaproteobacteria bacterium]|nr:hypothetical protein [Alphaproteobacteria bacterium]